MAILTQQMATVVEKCIFAVLYGLWSYSTATANTTSRSAFSGEIVLNEIMQSNVSSLMVQNEFPDSWIELYNPSDNAIDLHGYYLSKNSDIQGAWKINSETVVLAHDYLLIYCDKLANGLHTDFRLETGKGQLYLFSPSGKIVDSMSYPKMPAPNIAYGRRGDAGNKWQHEITATPGQANASQGSTVLAPAPIVSRQGGILSAPIQLDLCLPAVECPNDARIYYTLDGSEPTLESQSGTSIQLNIDHTMVIRAKVLSEQWLTVPAITHSYLMPPREWKVPVLSLVTDSNFLYDEGIGILSGESADTNANFMQKWHRPVNVEYFDSDTCVLNQLCETAVGGATSRVYSQKSLKLYASKRLAKKHLKGSFWPEKPEVGGVKSLMLRNGGSRCWGSRLNDAFVQQLFGTHVGNLDWQAYRPVIVYVNGEYKGSYELRERSDEDNVEATHGYDSDEIWQTNNMYYGEGNFGQLVNMVWDGKISYAEISALIDIDEMINYLIAEAYAGNTDWPDNNIFCWSPQAQGGHWRWILKDLDQFRFYPETSNFLNRMFVLGSEGRDLIESQKDKGYKFFSKLYSFAEFRDKFVDRLTIYLGDFLKPTVAASFLQSMRDEIEDEIPYTFAAYSPSTTYKWYDYEMQAMMEYVKNRAEILYQNLEETFSLGKRYPLAIRHHEIPVSMNEIELTEGDYLGAGFRKKPIRIKSLNPDNTEWMVTILRGDGSTDRRYVQGQEITLCEYDTNIESVDIELFAEDDGIDSTYIEKHQSPILYDLLGRRILQPQENILYIKNH